MTVLLQVRTKGLWTHWKNDEFFCNLCYKGDWTDYYNQPEEAANFSKQISTLALIWEHFWEVLSIPIPPIRTLHKGVNTDDKVDFSGLRVIYFVTAFSQLFCLVLQPELFLHSWKTEGTNNSQRPMPFQITIQSLLAFTTDCSHSCRSSLRKTLPYDFEAAGGQRPSCQLLKVSQSSKVGPFRGTYVHIQV